MTTYHKGEKQIQDLAGASLQAEQLEGMVQPSLSRPAMQFLLGQRMTAITTIDSNGAIWVSALVGEPGFIYPISPDQIVIDAHTLPRSDVLWRNVETAEQHNAAMVVINFGLRRRLRVNGTISADGDFLIFNVIQTYSNCPKYIQKRDLVHAPDPGSAEHFHSSTTAVLSDSDKELVSRSDTFFIGTYAPKGGADTSHRGGQAGFVQVLNDGLIRFPDYSGNNMFNTLGNLAVNPHLGILFVDYKSGDTLQISGRAAAIEPFRWHNGEKLGHVDVAVDKVIRNTGGPLGQWQFVEYSPYNPPL